MKEDVVTPEVAMPQLPGKISHRLMLYLVDEPCEFFGGYRTWQGSV